MLTIPVVLNPALRIARRYFAQGCTDFFVQPFVRSRFDAAQMHLDFRLAQLYRIQVGRVRRQILHFDSGCPELGLHGACFVNRKVVQHDNISGLQHRTQYVAHEDCHHCAVAAARQSEACRHAVTADRRQDVDLRSVASSAPRQQRGCRPPRDRPADRARLSLPTHRERRRAALTIEDKLQHAAGGATLALARIRVRRRKSVFFAANQPPQSAANGCRRQRNAEFVLNARRHFCQRSVVFRFVQCDHKLLDFRRHMPALPAGSRTRRDAARFRALAKQLFDKEDRDAKPFGEFSLADAASVISSNNLLSQIKRVSFHKQILRLVFTYLQIAI